MAEKPSGKLIITCREATSLISRKEEHTIGLPEKIALWIHLLICVFCRRFLAQTMMIGEEAGKLTADVPLSQEEKRKMDEAIRNGGARLP
jgi:hypothetical protein